jgi:hypothetical protein
MVRTTRSAAVNGAPPTVRETAMSRTSFGPTQGHSLWPNPADPPRAVTWLERLERWGGQGAMAVIGLALVSVFIF